MKQLFKIFAMLFFVCVLFTNKLSAQITLEHTFEEMVYITYFEGGYWSYIYPDDGSYLTITIYNSDYSLYKQVTFYPCEGYTRVSSDCRVISTEIIMVGNYLEGSSNCDYWLYDSNGDIIKYWGYNTYADAEVIPGNKLYVSCLDRETGQKYTEIYSIDGYESTSEKTIRSFSHAYPNPARNTISLPYNLNKGEQAEMLIYDVNGRMIDKKRIDSTFNKILLNVESYTPGVYFYSVNGVSQKFVVK